MSEATTTGTTTGTPATVQTLATEAAGYFETARRATGDTATGPREDGEQYVRVKAGAPAWITELVHDAHGDFFPDDIRYSMIREAVDYLAENDDADDDGHAFADDVPVYNGERIAWLASHGLRAGYVDEAAEEYGAETGAGERGIFGLIGLGIYAERAEVYGQVWAFLEARAEAVSDDDGDTTTGN